MVDDDISDYVEILNFNDANNPYYEQAVYLLIAVGGLIFLVGFLGCCGACCESSCMLLSVSCYLF